MCIHRFNTCIHVHSQRSQENVGNTRQTITCNNMRQMRQTVTKYNELWKMLGICGPSAQNSACPDVWKPVLVVPLPRDTSDTDTFNHTGVCEKTFLRRRRPLDKLA